MSVAGKGGRPPGLPKSGGRKKGTPNKSSLAISEKLADLGCDPIAILAGICMDEKFPIDARIRCAIELSSYVYPKRRPLDNPEPQGSREVKTIVEPEAVGATGASDDNGAKT
jgi:hypothetical protein